MPALDRKSHVPLPQQLMQWVISEIRRGRFKPGAPLPGTRPFAQSLGVHRNTVVAAFEELREQGWLETHRASHTRVSASLPIPAEAWAAQTRARTPGFALAPWHNSARSFQAAPKGVLDFTGGLPDARLFPSHLLARAYRRSLKLGQGKLLAFGSPAGDLLLRERVAQLLSERRAIAAGPDEVLITRGSQLALHLLSLVLLKPGDVVAVESPGYPSAREAFQLAQARLLPIGVDREGLDVAALARKLKTTKLRALYVTPHAQDPTTVTLSARRRLALLELARRHRFAILEADSDWEFQFDRTPVLPLASADSHGVVVYVGTLSKALAPGLRMGFVVAPRPLLEALVAVRGQVDRQGDLSLEHAVAELLEDGEVQRHALKARRVFHTRRDLLAQLLRKHLGTAIDFELPSGGLALWAKADRGIDVERWAKASLTRGVRFFTGRHYDPEGTAIPFIRLGFAHLNEAELGEAVPRMARALRR